MERKHEKAGVEIDDLPRSEEELSPEQAEQVKGGIIIINNLGSDVMGGPPPDPALNFVPGSTRFGKV